MIWIALTISVVSLVTALVALRWAHAAHALAHAGRRQVIRTRPRSATGAGGPRGSGGPDAGEPAPEHIAAAVGDANSLSGACHLVIRALESGGEPPTSSDYARVHRCSDLFTISVGRMRGSQHSALTRELTDELVTLHHCIVTEIRQHQEARYPFIGAKDTTFAGQVLRKFDAEVARLRRYAQTGSVPEANPFPVDFDTVRFVPKEAPARGIPPAPDSF